MEKKKNSGKNSLAEERIPVILLNRINEDPKYQTYFRQIPSMENNNLLEPFKQQWKRELVFRNTVATCTIKPSDVYYTTPCGKKLRSVPDIRKYLRDSSSTLELQNFSFVKARIGGPNELKTVQNAKYENFVKRGIPKQMDKRRWKVVQPAVQQFISGSTKMKSSVTSENHKNEDPSSGISISLGDQGKFAQSEINDPIFEKRMENLVCMPVQIIDIPPETDDSNSRLPLNCEQKWESERILSVQHMMRGSEPYTILSSVFPFLSVTDLEQCKKVCKFWKTVGSSDFL